tara:strand:+ start:1318 stop:1887 length:570 start_codon:yes stop_codon:yes gene_type:complete
MSLIIKGIWRDTLTYEDGRVVVGDWMHNQPQVTGSTLMSALFAETATNANPTLGGIQYMAVGAGLAAWDSQTPVPGTDLLYTDTTLKDEKARFALSSSDFSYLDVTSEAAVGTPTSGSKSRLLKITVSLTSAVDDVLLREFALFGGNATGTADSGYMINWIAHTAFTKTSGVSVVREIKLKFLSKSEYT